MGFRWKAPHLSTMTDTCVFQIWRAKVSCLSAAVCLWWKTSPLYTMTHTCLFQVCPWWGENTSLYTMTDNCVFHVCPWWKMPSLYTMTDACVFQKWRTKVSCLSKAVCLWWKTPSLFTMTYTCVFQVCPWWKKKKQQQTNQTPHFIRWLTRVCFRCDIKRCDV